MTHYNLPNSNIQAANRFVFAIDRLPNFSQTVTGVTLPGLTIQPVTNSGGTPLSRIVWEGDHMTYEALTVEFQVLEEMRNWKEVYLWMNGIAFPTTFEERKDLKQGTDKTVDGTYRKPTPYPRKQGAIYSAGSLILTSSHNNPHTIIKFIDLHPIALSSIKFGSQTTDYENIIASVTFAYDRYEIESA